MGARWGGGHRPRQAERSGRDPMRDYYEYIRRQRRNARLRTFATIALMVAAAWAILIMTAAALAYVFVTFG